MFLIWLLAVVIGIAGIVSLFRGQILWGIILIYLPAMKITLHLTPNFHDVMKVFGVWFVLMFAAAR